MTSPALGDALGPRAALRAEPSAQPLPPARSLWIFSPAIDVLAFTLPALLSLAAVFFAAELGLEGTSPEWLWIVAVLGVDVAHVWSTLFVTYLDPDELARRPQRYWLVPGLGWVLGVVVYALAGALWFWRVLAYLAVFHFVRQQYGWMALYRARERDRSRVGRWIDAAAIYAATLYPLLWWHAHLPRQFDWFMPGDFVPGMPAAAVRTCGLLYVAALLAYAARALSQLLRGAPVSWGKHALLGTTAAAWYVGIIATDADAAFTLTNVLAHGIPYAVLVFAYARHRQSPSEPSRRPATATQDAKAAPEFKTRARALVRRRLAGPLWLAASRFVACLWLLAFLEELLWDRAIWHERPQLFGAAIDVGPLETALVPLLALPQLTHYLLDGLFWRRGDNPALRAWLSAP